MTYHRLTAHLRSIPSWRSRLSPENPFSYLQIFLSVNYFAISKAHPTLVGLMSWSLLLRFTNPCLGSYLRTSSSFSSLDCFLQPLPCRYVLDNWSFLTPNVMPFGDSYVLPGRKTLTYPYYYIIGNILSPPHKQSRSPSQNASRAENVSKAGWAAVCICRVGCSDADHASSSDASEQLQGPRSTKPKGKIVFSN
jgi:hypothetical protein